MTLILLLVYLVIAVSLFLALMIAAPDDKPGAVAMFSLLWMPIAVGSALYFAGRSIVRAVRRVRGTCDKE